MKINDLIFKNLKDELKNRENTVKSILKNSDRKTTLVLGAGISCSAGLPGWDNLISELCYLVLATDFWEEIHGNGNLPDAYVEDSLKYINSSISEFEKFNNIFLKSSLLEIGEYLSVVSYFPVKKINKESDSDVSKGIINALIKMVLTNNREYKEMMGLCNCEHCSCCNNKNQDCIINRSIGKLAKLIIEQNLNCNVVTYNYDNLFEYCLQKICSQNNLFESLYDEAKATSQYKIHVNHPHGYLNITDMKDNSGKIIKDSRKCILTESSYYEIERYQYCWENQVVANALNDGTCVFFGFSGTDYNFKRILNNIKSESDGKDSNHFIIVAIDDTVNSLDDFDEKCDRKLPGEGISMESKVLLHRSLAMKELYWRKKNILPIWTTIEELPALIERISH